MILGGDAIRARDFRRSASVLCLKSCCRLMISLSLLNEQHVKLITSTQVCPSVRLYPNSKSNQQAPAHGLHSLTIQCSPSLHPPSSLHLQPCPSSFKSYRLILFCHRIQCRPLTKALFPSVRIHLSLLSMHDIHHGLSSGEDKDNTSLASSLTLALILPTLSSAQCTRHASQAVRARLY